MRLLRSTLVALLAAAAAPAAADVAVRDAWVAEMPPGARNAAGYVVFANDGDVRVQIVSAQSDRCDRVEFHATDLSDGIARMRQLPGLEIPAAGEVALAPGGTHLMLIHPEPLRKGDVVRIVFALADGQDLAVEFPVKKQGEDEDAAQHEQHAH